MPSDEENLNESFEKEKVEKSPLHPQPTDCDMDFFGPALPVHLLRKNSLESKERVKIYGPTVPDHLSKKEELNEATSNEKRKICIGPEVPEFLKSSQPLSKMEEDETFDNNFGPSTTLMATGDVTNYYKCIMSQNSNTKAMPQWGIMNRSDIGFLIYDDCADSKNMEESKQPGSRLKTPSFPVWVINCSGHYGVLFNTNSELLRNYHAERRFDLHYFSVGGSHLFISIDTRYHEEKTESRDNGKGDDNVTMTSSPIEKLIHTKWQDAHINFNGMTPMV